MISKVWVWVLLIIIFCQFLDHFPDYYGYIRKPDSLWYSGQVSWFDPWDMNVYFSAVGWGRRSSLLFENIYDTSPQVKMPIYFVYTAIGKLFSPFTLSNFLVFHLSGIILGTIFMSIVWWFTGIFVKERQERLLVFAFLFFGGGAGWLLFPEIQLPDMGNPGFLMLSPLRRPHEAISLSFFVLAIGLFWKGTVFKKNKDLLLGTLASFGTIFLHPYNIMTLLTIFGGLAVFWFLTKKRLDFVKPLVLLGIIGASFYFLIARDLLQNPGFSGLAGQIQYSANPLFFILGWGLLFPFILISLLSQGKSKEIIFFKLWFILHFLLIYFPINFQKLLVRGLFIPAVFLTATGVKIVAQKVKADYRLISAVLLIFSSMTVVCMFFLRLAEVDKKDNRWIYLTREEGEVIEFLKESGKEGEGVLASYRIANMIPANSDKKVYAGHTFQTPEFDKRIVEVNRFYAGEMKEEEAKAFLGRAHIVWVFWGPDEKFFSKTKNFSYQNLVELVIENEIASLYKVRQSL